MRKMLYCLGTACLLMQASFAQAQDRAYEPSQSNEADHQRASERTSIASPQFLIYQRAALKSQERTRRIEMRKWYGYSHQRPSNFATYRPHYWWHTGYNPWATGY